LSTFFPSMRRNKKVVGPTIIYSLLYVYMMLQTGEMANFSYYSLVSISLSPISIKPNIPLMEWWKYLAFEKPSLIQYFLDFCLSRLSLYNEIGSKIPYSDPFLNNPNYHHFLSKDPQNQWPRCWNQEVLWKSRPKINIFWPKMIIKS
jgi:hypothetical protein